MSAEFRAAVRAALADAAGGPLGRRIRAATITAIVADARGDERDAIALTELVDALERAGVPRGRQFVLLGSADAGALPAREAARRLRARLGIAVLAHDPLSRASFHAGDLADGTRVELDDELREAEEVVIAGRFAAGRGGPAAIWPGLASVAARRVETAALAALPADRREPERHARACAAHALASAGFALVWGSGEPPRVLAGDPAAVFAQGIAAGWLAAGAPDAREGAVAARGIREPRPFVAAPRRDTPMGALPTGGARMVRAKM